MKNNLVVEELIENDTSVFCDFNNLFILPHVDEHLQSSGKFVHFQGHIKCCVWQNMKRISSILWFWWIAKKKLFNSWVLEAFKKNSHTFWHNNRAQHAHKRQWTYLKIHERTMTWGKIVSHLSAVLKNSYIVYLSGGIHNLLCHLPALSTLMTSLTFFFSCIIIFFHSFSLSFSLLFPYNYRPINLKVALMPFHNLPSHLFRFACS